MESIRTLPRTEAAVARDALAFPPAGAVGVDVASGPRDCAEALAITRRLQAAIDNTAPGRPDDFVVLRLADLRQMDTWGITIQGETLHSYFDLGSIDDAVPHYPVTGDEARWLRGAMEAWTGATCGAAAGRRRWRDTA
ncbi:hypothetical protein NDR89_21910 [Cupriavidus gilardii]|uniref:Uncharacterized protein n=1 Tax=Cupriavidus gilardii TaxID=82541 RepID=A0ABY4VSN1_9BURK|nr:hypothetical protein [Cupriavidus gilardii]USE79272.1 hypothetical protein NDR89_21910 [Cupriavidus gilardii]